MANRKVSALDPVTAAGGDSIYVVQGGASKRSILGAAGAALLPASLAADVRDYLDTAPYVATRTAMKALDATKDTACLLTESGREGLFFAVDYASFSAMIDADTQEGIFARSTQNPAKAFMRATVGTEWWFSWFGIVSSVLVSGPDQAPAINAMMALANLARPAVINTGPGIFRLLSSITTPTYQLGLKGVLTGSQQTILYKDYDEASASRGVIALTTHGCWIENILFLAAAGHTGGSAISFIPPSAVAQVGSAHIRNCRISMGDSANYSIFWDGEFNTSAAPGIRDTFFDNCTLFGAAAGTIVAKTVRGLWFANCNGLTSGGTGTTVLYVQGIVGFFSDLVNWSGGNLSGVIDLDKCSRVTLEAFNIGTNVVNTSDVTQSVIRAAVRVAGGTLQHNWDNDNCSYDVGTPYIDYASTTLTASQSNVTGDGTEQVVIFNTVGGVSLMDWTGALVYDTGAANGRFTAKRTGPHQFSPSITLTGIAAGHTSADLMIKRYNSSAVLQVTQTLRLNPAAIAVSGRVTIPLHKVLFMSAGDYLTVSVTVSGGAKDVDIDGTTAFTSAEFGLAA